MMKKRITAILAAAIITVGASVPAFADSDFNTAGNDAQELHALAFVHVRGTLLMHEVLCV